LPRGLPPDGSLSSPKTQCVARPVSCSSWMRFLGRGSVLNWCSKAVAGGEVVQRYHFGARVCLKFESDAVRAASASRPGSTGTSPNIDRPCVRS
jgi:hypothetical protein